MIDIKKKLQDEIAALEYELHVELPKEILKARKDDYKGQPLAKDVDKAFADVAAAEKEAGKK